MGSIMSVRTSCLTAAALLAFLSQTALAESTCTGVVTGLSGKYDPSKGTGYLAVRSGSTTQSRQIGELFNGDNVEVVGRQGKWVEIATSTHSQAWVFSKYLEVSCVEQAIEAGRTNPSFDCRKARLPDEIAICQSPDLAELDLTMSAGYKVLRATKGKAYAEELGRPFLKLRMACGNDDQCIYDRQIEAIQAYIMAGAPITLPNWATNEDEGDDEVVASTQENTQASQELTASVQQNTQAQAQTAQASIQIASAVSENTQAIVANTDAMQANAASAQSVAQSVQANAAATEQVASAVNDAAQLSAEKADEMNKRIADLSAQIATLSKVLEEQKKQQVESTDIEEKPAIEQTIVAINLRIEVLQKEFTEKEVTFGRYLTSIKPNDRDLYLTARKASQLYPKVPYYIPGTNETGEFWVEPKVTDTGELMFNFRLIDPAAENDTTRSLINMNLEQLELSQKALFKLFKNSVIAHEKKIRENYTKRVICFPTDQCPEERQKGEKGKTSTEVVFMIYEDGSTGGRLQQNKGAFQEGVNFSIDSALLLQAYLAHVIKEAKLEFESGTRTQKQLDEMFQ
jgi:uncharacterized protein